MRALALLFTVSCSFPNVLFADASIPDGGNDVGSGDDASDAAMMEAGEGGDPCDKDNDGYRDLFSCGGTDCNDNDPRINPDAGAGVGFIYDIPDSGNLKLPLPNGDWNCDGVISYQFTIVVPSNSCSLVNCSVQGFTFDAGCGVTGPWGSCVPPVATCTYVNGGSKTQGCL